MNCTSNKELAHKVLSQTLFTRLQSMGLQSQTHQSNFTLV